MSLQNIIFIFLFSLFIVFLQSSFFFNSFALSLFLFVFLYNLLEDPLSLEGFFAGFISGFWLDIYTYFPVGIFIILMLLLAYTTKVILRKYVGIPSLS